MKHFALLLAAVIIVGFIPNAFAHTFSSDESASFIATIEELKAHLQLVQGNFASDTAMAQEHAEHAASHIDEHLIEEIAEKNERLGRELPASLADLSESLSNSSAQQVDQKIAYINDLLAETVIVRVESRQMDNVTLHALVMANLGDSVLEAYNGAYDIKTGNDTHEDHGSSEMERNMTHDAMNESAIVSMAHYHSAHALAARMQEYYNNTLKPLASANDTAAVADLEAALAQLNQAIKAQEPPADIEVLVHTQVHANLQKAYNLQVIPEFPLPLLTISAIAGAVVLTRLRRR